MLEETDLQVSVVASHTSRAAHRTLLAVHPAGAVVKELDLWQLLKKRARLVGSTLRSRSPAFKAALARRFAEEFKMELRRGDLRPVIDKARLWPITQGRWICMLVYV